MSMSKLINKLFPGSLLSDSELNDDRQLEYDPAAPQRPVGNGKLPDGRTELKIMWEETLESAEEECNKPPSCCKSITVSINCSNDTDVASAFSNKRIPDSNCSTKKTITCK